MVRSLGVIEYEIIRKPPVKDRFVVYDVKIMVYELLLNGPLLYLSM